MDQTRSGGQEKVQYMPLKSSEICVQAAQMEILKNNTSVNVCYIPPMHIYNFNT